jgi:hypothetical protein
MIAEKRLPLLYAAEALTALAEIAHNPDSAPASRDEARKILERRLPQ